MQQLIVIRHALAGKRDGKRWPDDDARPLSAAGIREFEQVARGLAFVVQPPTELLSSPLVRATQTARILIKAAEYPKSKELEELRPHCRTIALIRALRRQKSDRIAVVGHEPLLSKLIARLLMGTAKAGAFELDKGGIAVIEFDRRIAEGKGRLMTYASPKWLLSLR